LIIAMNTLRMSYGLPALTEDPIIDAVAQSTAEIMAANQMSWHIGDVSGRLQSAGFGGGSKVWATENFAVGNMSIDEIMLVWADPDHMIPAVNPAYCNIGAGTAKSANGMTYYVLQAAYTANKACGEYRPPAGFTPQPGGGTNTGGTGGVSQVIIPVKIATPDKDGKIYHVVEAGQSFWSIAVAYKITIKDIETWNNISKNSKLQIGQRLFIPGENTKGYSTPTPVGMVQVSKPDKDGKITHTVGSYQTLTTISQAYGVKIDTILALNGIQQDWPLQIGQKLLIYPGNITPSATPRPLTPIEKLTPEGDGKYYHTIKSGETLSWIADLYDISLNDLMAWNGLDAGSILQPNRKLLLQVTPPATVTPTPGPATATATITLPLPSPTSSNTPTQTPIIPTATATLPAAEDGSSMIWIGLGVLAAGGLLLVVVFSRKR
jgi:LysM repeat protein